MRTRPDTREPVLLLHGLWRTKVSTYRLAARLREAGYQPIPVGYYSGIRTLRQNARAVAAALARKVDLDAPGPLHVVTFSLGGLIARTLLTEVPHRRRGRLCQLAPPNQGAFMAAPLRWLLPGRARGTVYGELGLDAAGRPRHAIPPVETHEVGVVAIRRPNRSGRFFWLPDENDGIVRVSETELPEAADWIQFDGLHYESVTNRVLHDEAIHFLRHGRFTAGAKRLGAAAPVELPPAPAQAPTPAVVRAT